MDSTRPRRLLVLHHAPSPTLQAIAHAVVAGADDETITGVEVIVQDPLMTSVADMAQADGYIIGTAAHFGYMSGALKELFDRCFLRLGGALDDGITAVDGVDGMGLIVGADFSTAGRPFGLWAHGRYDVTGAVRSVLSITGALGWRQSASVLEVIGDLTEEARASAYDLGGTIAALLAD